MEKLKQIFATILNIPMENIGPGLSPDNTPTWDSLNAIILVTEIENAFNIKFSFDEVMEVKNFSDAINLVSSKGVELL